MLFINRFSFTHWETSYQPIINFYIDRPRPLYFKPRKWILLSTLSGVSCCLALYIPRLIAVSSMAVGKILFHLCAIKIIVLVYMLIAVVSQSSEGTTTDPESCIVPPAVDILPEYAFYSRIDVLTLQGRCFLSCLRHTENLTVSHISQCLESRQNYTQYLLTWKGWARSQVRSIYAVTLDTAL